MGFVERESVIWSSVGVEESERTGGGAAGLQAGTRVPRACNWWKVRQ